MRFSRTVPVTMATQAKMTRVLTAIEAMYVAAILDLRREECQYKGKDISSSDEVIEEMLADLFSHDFKTQLISRLSKLDLSWNGARVCYTDTSAEEIERWLEKEELEEQLSEYE